MARLYSKNQKIIFAFLTVWFLIFFYANITETLARRNVESFLEDVATHTLSARPPISPDITIRGEPDGNPADTLVALQQMKKGWSHHSHPTDSIDIRVKDSTRSLHLVLRRDSDIKQEYWVFCPDCRFALNDVARLTTNAFDRY